MRPIPPDRRARLAADPRYKYCSIPDEYCETGKIDWHHVWLYAGSQIDEDWAILSACQYHHGLANRPDIQRRFQRESLSRATDEDLARYPRKDWAQIIRYLVVRFVNSYQVILAFRAGEIRVTAWPLGYRMGLSTCKGLTKRSTSQYSLMFIFQATKEGGLDVGSDFNKARFKAWLKKHAGLRVRIELDEPESNDLRRYFEGAVVSEVCHSWEWCDPGNHDDLLACRELLKAEFNGRWLPTPAGGMRKVALSTKTQKVLRPFVNRVTDWMAEQGIPIPNPKLYKQWRDSGLMAGAGSYREWLREQGMKSDGTPLVG